MPTKTLSLFALIALVSLVVFYALRPTVDAESIPAPQLPWQIEVDIEGHSSVFGITLGRTTVAELLDHLGEDHDMAIISNSDDQSGLEIYYSHFKSGPLKAKLIATVDSSEEQRMAIQERAANAEFMASGARKFSLSEEDLARVQPWTIASLELIPSARLDEEIILSRFGANPQKLRVDEETQLFLYPDLGLAITLNDDAKESLTYVAANRFAELKQQLEKAVVQQP